MTESPDLASRLRDRGLRLTAQRELILRAVEGLGHATPDELVAEVQRQAAAINASTVYRNLEVLEELGLVHHVHLGDRAPTYHSRSDHEHFHLVCRVCGTVTSVDPHLADGLVERLQEVHRFVADVGHLAVFGHCVDCAPAAEGRGHRHHGHRAETEGES